MTLATSVLLFLAAAVGGALNSVAGGGSFITFPALLFAGVPAITANATSTVGLWPAGVASAFGYRRDLISARGTLALMSGASLVGGIVGATLLLRTSESSFVHLVPLLLLGATILFTLGPAVSARLRAQAGSARAPVAVACVQVAIAIYGGYFGGGIGILMLASLSLLGMTHIHQMNALKTILASFINGVAVVIFVARGAVLWAPAATMIVGGLGGGYLGARVARRLDPRRVRGFVLVIAWAMTAWFFVRRFVI